ncbi:MAG: non-ribosomal peptide synthetase, partial [Rhodobacteraceae bacterium]|nr:non-ribosomal peptide synthetase [Paracoccaceae bacterium]
MFETIACLAHHAHGAPDSLAIDDGQAHLSYSQLWAAAAALRVRIDETAVAADSPVFVCLERSASLIVAYCAALMSGRPYVPMDPSHPADFRLQIVQAAGPGVVLVSPRSAGGFPAGAENLVLVDPLAAVVEASALVPAPAPAASDMEFILFTSGSTGTSKGVKIAASAMLRAANGLARRLDLSSESRVLHFAAPAFDSATLEWVLALTQGACLVLVPDVARNDPTALGLFLTDRGVTHAILPSAILPYLPLKADYALKALIVAGDVCPEPVLWAWAAHYATYNGYGPTEGTVCTSVTRVYPGESVSIHEVIDGMTLGLRDAQGGDTEDGEIWIGGPQVALGYLRGEGKQNKAFVCDGDGVRWFKTGDWAKKLAGGRLQFAGRRDSQVKVRGNRVDLSQLDQVVAAVAGVQSVCSLAHAVGAGDKRLFLFVASDAEPESLRQAITTAVTARLPEYYRPAAIQVMESLPRSANDKIDRVALRICLEAVALPDDRLTALFAETSGTIAPAEADNFFACGGNSIAVLRLLQAVQTEFGKQIPLRAFQENPTLGGMRRLLSGATASGNGIVRSGLRREGHYPLTPQQEAIWFLHQSNPESKAYLAEATIWFEGHFDQEAMERALNEVFARHEIYRTLFGAEGGTPYQRVLE